MLFFDCPMEVMEQRLLKRGETSGRADDNLAVIKKRFDTFVEQSMPVVEAYRSKGLVRSLSAVPPPNVVFESVVSLFEGGSAATAVSVNATVDELVGDSSSSSSSSLPRAGLPVIGVDWVDLKKFSHHVKISREHKLIYCGIPKVISTLQFQNTKSKQIDQNIRQIYVYPRPRSGNFQRWHAPSGSSFSSA